MKIPPRRAGVGLALLGLALLATPDPKAAASSAGVPEKLFHGLTWRQVGPFRGGRVLAVSGVPNQLDTWYLGAAIGGVWKTTDGGHEWKPIFDAQPLGSIGAIAVAPSDPTVLYVGTGEHAPREDVSLGNGVYRSRDAGQTFSHVGLPDSQTIGRILVDPADPDVVLVAAQGHVYGPSSERGVFRSTDGGASWARVLFKDEGTGAIDLSRDPSAPGVVFAALWQMQRTPWSLSSGGPGSGLYRSKDGGASWTLLADHGLPPGPLGKIGVAVAPGSQARRVYALIEAAAGGLYRSDDAGDTWTRVNDNHLLWSRAWYFTRLAVAPNDPDTVFAIGNALWKSTDGGKDFRKQTLPGADNHDLWIHPGHPERMIEANDQGVLLSVNGGVTWDKRNNLPIGQFYHVSTDEGFPYTIYGAQQDMGALAIASRGADGIGDRDFYNVGGDDGECGYIWPDPLDPNLVVAGGYGGALTLFDKRTRQLRDIAPWSNATGGHAAGELRYRFTWTSPVVFSPQDPHVLYMGSQFLMETRDRGASWRVVSRDLTRNDKSKQLLSGGPITRDNASVEYYDVIFSIAPSPLRAGRIWIGTDDGLVQLTSDGGATWQRVTPPGLPEWAKVSLVEASRFDADTAYVAVDAHKLDDVRPYLFRTRDAGRTWTTITDGLAAPSFVHAVREDPKRRGLLFAGTETGPFVSFDDGEFWQPLTLNLPPTSVRDLTIHDDDLVVATHGRSIWTLDDITPLREATPGLAERDVHLFAPRPAVRHHEASAYTIPVAPAGANPPDGAVFNYYLAARATSEVTLEILDHAGRRAGWLTSTPAPRPEEDPSPLERSGEPAVLSTEAGMHRVAWSLRYPLPDLIPGTAYNERPPRGVLALPGTYTIKLSVGGRTVSSSLEVKRPPNVDVPAAALAQEFELATRLMAMLAQDHAVVREILALRSQLAERRPALSGATATSADVLDRQAETVLDALYEPRAKAGVDLLNFPMRLSAQIAYLEDEVDFGDGAPTAQFQEMARFYEMRLWEQFLLWKDLKERAAPALNALLERQGAAPLTLQP